MRNQDGLSKFIIIVLFGFLAAVILGIVFIIIGSGSTPTPKPVALSVWGVWDESTDLVPLFDAYTSAHPYVTFTYRKLRAEEYEEMLLKGWATGTGPDIFSIPSTWVSKYKTDFMAPAPATTKVAYYTTKKVLFKTETEITYQTDTSLSASDVRRNYVDVVYDDVVADGRVYGLPFGIDTLVMYYNRDLLNQASLVQPPATWSDFINAVTRLTITDDQNNIVRAATALGTHSNIDAGTDMLTLLMLQNGTTMTVGSQIAFASPSTTDPSYAPGIEALRFYTDFANPSKAVYTWNDSQPDALNQFAAGELAFFFGYRFNEPDIMAKNRGVDYDIAPIPQVNPNDNVTFANYSIYSVAQQSAHANEAWNFLQFASNPARLKGYLESTSQISAARAVLNEQISDPDLALLAQQALTAQSWFHGRNPNVMEEAFDDMIDATLIDPSQLSTYLKTAAQTIQTTY